MPYAASKTLLQVGNAALPEAFATLGEIVSVTGPSMTQATVDVSTLDNTSAQYVAAKIFDIGEVTLDVNFIALPGGAQDNLIDLIVTPTVSLNYQICWPDLAGNEQAFVPADVNAGTDEINIVAHGLTTGQPIRFTTDNTLPDPLVAGVTYYAIKTAGANDFLVAATNALAVAATPINLIDGGAGNHKVTHGTRYDFDAYVTGAAPSGAVKDRLAAALTFRLTGNLTINP